MKLRITSDWHLNSYKYHYPDEAASNTEMSKAWQDKFLPVMPDDSEQILIIAGDIDNGLNRSFTKQVFHDIQQRFYQTIFVYGNHDFYGQRLRQDGKVLISPQSIQGDMFSTRLTRYEEKLDIHATTLWTDFDKGNVEVMDLLSRRLNDYFSIKSGDSPITPIEVYEVHNSQLDWLMNYTTKTKLDKQRCVIVTHHAPSAKSVSPKYVGHETNPGFVSDFDDFVAACGAVVWVHGHVHSSHDYYIGPTRIICNPVGYMLSSDREFENQEGYNPRLVIEV